MDSSITRVGSDEHLVCYFEDGSFSVVPKTALLPFSPEEEPYLAYKRTSKKFSQDAAVQRATVYWENGTIPITFKWLLVMRNEFFGIKNTFSTGGKGLNGVGPMSDSFDKPQPKEKRGSKQFKKKAPAIERKSTQIELVGSAFPSRPRRSSLESSGFPNVEATSLDALSSSSLSNNGLYSNENVASSKIIKSSVEYNINNDVVLLSGLIPTSRKRRWKELYEIETASNSVAKSAINNSN